MNTYTTIRNLINQLGPQGGTVMLQSTTYVDDQSGPIMLKPNIHICGSGGTIIQAPTSGAMDILTTSTNVQGPYKLTSKINEYSNKIQIAASNVFQLWDHLLITVNMGTNVFAQMVQIYKISNQDIYVMPFIPFDVPLESNYGVYKFDLLSNIRVSDITFDGQSNPDKCRGVFGVGLVNCVFNNLTFKNFVGAAGLMLYQGFGNRVSNLTFLNCGNPDEGDFMLTEQTAHQCCDIQSWAANGFGPVWVRSNFGTCTNFIINASHGRGLKFIGCLNNQICNVQSHDNRFVGIALTFGSKHNQLINVSGCRHISDVVANNEGLWTSGHDNADNVISHGLFLNNQTKDVFVDPSDHRNVVVDCVYDTVYQGACNDNKIYPSLLGGLKQRLQLAFSCFS
jgi:hypothetical protein